MGIRVKLDKEAFLPERAHYEDAGWDIRTPYDFEIEAGGSATIDTGVHVEIPYSYVGMLKSKSGLNVKCGITSEGVIDCGYTGAVIAKLYNHGDKAVAFKRGDKITQLVVVPINTDSIEEVSEISGGRRGNAGFGSTGR